MKKLIVILPIVAALSGCVSEEARRAYESAKAAQGLVEGMAARKTP